MAILLQNLHKLDRIPEGFQNGVFEILFEDARMAKMNREELNKYYQSLKHLNEMNIAEIELKEMREEVFVKNSELAVKDSELAVKNNVIAVKDNVIAVHVNTIAQKDDMIAVHINTIAQKADEIAELRRRLGLN